MEQRDQMGPKGGDGQLVIEESCPQTIDPPSLNQSDALLQLLRDNRYSPGAQRVEKRSTSTERTQGRDLDPLDQAPRPELP